MALFKNFADVTAADLEFTNIVSAIRETLKDSFYTWQEYPGIESSELTEYLGQYGDLYEDANEDLHVVYPVDSKMLNPWQTGWLTTIWFTLRLANA